MWALRHAGSRVLRTAAPPGQRAAWRLMHRGASPVRPSAAASAAVPSKKATSIYDTPALYDEAFGYRDFDAETDFLEQAYAKHGDGQPLRRVLEIGCERTPAARPPPAAASASRPLAPPTVRRRVHHRMPRGRAWG